MQRSSSVATLGVLLLLLAAVASYHGWNWVQQERERAWRMELGRALSAYSSRQNAVAEQILERLLPSTEKQWPTGPHLVETLTWLGAIDRTQHKYDQATPLLKRAIEISEAQGEVSTTSVGRAKMNLGVIARDESDHVEAQRLFSEALEILSKDPHMAEGDDDAALLNLGFLAKEEGDYQEAVSYLTRAVSGYQILYGKAQARDFANAHFQLADAYIHVDNYSDAVEQFQAAVNMYQQLEGPDGEDVRNSLSGLALAQQQGGRTGSAASVTQSLDTRDADGETLINLGNIASHRKDYVEAAKFYQRACAAYEKSAGPNDAGLATALTNLGDLYRDQPQFDLRKAELLLKRALAIREKAIGSGQPEIAQSLSDLSLLYFYEKKFPTAEEFARRALPLEQKAFGEDSLAVSTTLNRLGIAERESGKLKEAEADLRRALAIRDEKHAPKSWIVLSLENLAAVYVIKGQNAEANALLARAEALRSSSGN